ncbi:PAS domain-containing protein [Nocardioides sp.]|uniref:PAS domain-containing protein n=1 Tax=Nocardioides sp. TaxID=35761 RepID=UPI002620B551|nr:PAS domain-containing protein [Nocardioides sp.]MDI6911577.1 PAS domain-containing protein [Nocardioides sp.]
MDADSADPGSVDAALAAEAARRAAEEELELLRQRMENAQALANMGDYDWHIPTDTNRWSDQLFRIYGHEPQSFNATYERFLSLIHPEDRERVQAIHQHAYATGEPYEMIERVVRPDGEVRYLHSNGQVIMGPDGSPERMRGTCVDVTDQVLAEREREAAATRLGEVRLRRRQAAEINDNVVQGLTAAMYALELGDAAGCQAYLDRTLGSARTMMHDLVEPLTEGELDAGDLVRMEPATLRDG